ncbi:type VII secretion system-associated protein [Amycolatopsis antarctica]|uniref:type VII secretion system-associated protein n=1 Tax=Amycolatopsis antarctica TaxID=1854586 RepID=UPI000D7C9A0B|nr:type VII secretion system-associated protein [Amycolatopsis antarctica]
MADRGDNRLLFVDPAAAPPAKGEQPPTESIVGEWPVEDGKAGRFRANPGYVPAGADSPSDPIDAILRLLAREEAEPDQVRLLIRDCTFQIAMNGDGRPLIVRSQDGILCAVVATAETQRRRIASPEWIHGDVEELVDLLSDDVDVLFNPGGPAAARLAGSFVRSARTLEDGDVDAAYAGFLERGVEVPPGENDSTEAVFASALVVESPSPRDISG